MHIRFAKNVDQIRISSTSIFPALFGTFYWMCSIGQKTPSVRYFSSDFLPTANSKPLLLSTVGDAIGTESCRSLLAMATCCSGLTSQHWLPTSLRCSTPKVVSPSLMILHPCQNRARSWIWLVMKITIQRLCAGLSSTICKAVRDRLLFR